MGRTRVKHPGTPVIVSLATLPLCFFTFPVISLSLHGLIPCTGYCINIITIVVLFCFVLFS